MKMPASRAPRPPRALEAVRRAVARHNLIRPGDKVLVAWSGGPDSTALLHILLELRLKVPFEVAAAHFDHRLRPAAAADAAFVRREAARLGIPFLAARRDVRAFARARKLNLEDAARLLRYAFLNRAAARLGADRIATGHTLDDQAETVLIRLLRGSGPRGLSGIHPSIGGTVIRPLLEASRADVLDYCRRRGLAFRRDETNADPRYVRNRIRHRLLPYLERNFGPGGPAALGRLAEIEREEDAYLDAAAAKAYASLLRPSARGASSSLDARSASGTPRGHAPLVTGRGSAPAREGGQGGVASPMGTTTASPQGGRVSAGGAPGLPGGSLPPHSTALISTSSVRRPLEGSAERSPQIDARRLAALPVALARRCVRLFLAGLKGDLLAVGLEDVESVRALAEGAAATLPGGLVVRRARGALVASPASAEPSARAGYFYLWDGRGRLPVPEAGLAFSGRRLRSAGARPSAFDDAVFVRCDLDALTLPLEVRPRLEGDRYKPYGAPGRKKLKEILRARRIPAAARGALPVFCSGESIVWAPGLPVADAFKVTPATKRVLEIRRIQPLR